MSQHPKYNNIVDTNEGGVPLRIVQTYGWWHNCAHHRFNNGVEVYVLREFNRETKKVRPFYMNYAILQRFKSKWCLRYLGRSMRSDVVITDPIVDKEFTPYWYQINRDDTFYAAIDKLPKKKQLECIHLFPDWFNWLAQNHPDDYTALLPRS